MIQFRLILCLLLATATLVLASPSYALDYRSVAVPKAVSYDAPSTESTKTYLLGQGYPVEIIVNLGNWLKVRDDQGGLSWVESKDLAENRTVLVTTATEIKASEDNAAATLATVQKDVVLDLVSPIIKNGWVNVKHRDGITGVVKASTVWGLN